MPAGEVTAVGTAWAPGRGIRRVEVRYDDGPWRDATLATGVNPFIWRMWRHTEVLRPGSHSITVRATDGNGEVQPEERVDPINPGPDGATGWYEVQFSVVLTPSRRCRAAGPGGHAVWCPRLSSISA